MCFVILAGRSSVAVPASLAFSTMGVFASFAACGLKHVNKRLDEITSNQKIEEIATDE